MNQQKKCTNAIIAKKLLIQCHRRRHELRRCKYNDDVIMKLMDEKDKYIKKIESEKKKWNASANNSIKNR